VQYHPECTFVELEVAFRKCYRKVQTNEHVHMALKVIKQTTDKKVEVYYECILKLTNCLHHKTNDSLIMTFSQAGLVPYLQITTTRMKWDILFLQKDIGDM
jgi:hypothetical protein